MKFPRNCLIAALFFFSACAAPRTAVNSRADFSAIKRVAVLTFGGSGGELAADLFTQSLLAHGADVVERQQLSAVMQEQSLSSSPSFDQATAKQLGKLLGVDALFVGSVAASTPPSTYLVSTSDKTLIASVTQLAGGSVYSDGSLLGMPNSQLVSTTADVSLVTRMVDVETGSILWSASMSYDGFDIQTAMFGITDAFVTSLAPIWPALSRIK
ncbi:MAG: CsgG/HfaB family protein [Elusimicrobia bacterium]|nr:CsgG/HfaB family protein [Elusimicrobiota bacterium]